MLLGYTNQSHQQDLERIERLRYIDDEFMTVCLDDNIEAVELILRIVLGKEDIKVTSVHTQVSMKNLQGRSVILDALAEDSRNQKFDCEIQRSDAGAGRKRARHNSSLLDAYFLKPGEEPEELPECYTIFITEHDVIHGGLPVYPVERYITIGDKKELFNDGSHILYVNGQYRGDDAVGRLMHDFCCEDPDKMNFEALARKARYFKKDVEGVNNMCKMLEDMRKEAAQNAVKEKAQLMLSKGRITADEISVFFPELSKEDVKAIKSEAVQMA